MAEGLSSLSVRLCDTVVVRLLALAQVVAEEVAEEAAGRGKPSCARPSTSMAGDQDTAGLREGWVSSDAQLQPHKLGFGSMVLTHIFADSPVSGHEPSC